MMLWVGRIRSAIDEDRFRLYALTIAPTRETRHAPARAEVLLRMVDRDGGIIPPIGKPEPLEAFLEAERTAGAQPAAG
jgi:EAL domain-containing protein (putative c-di-GMP-specific phosphodiesterase class I)